jgi:hypothetical protein
MMRSQVARHPNNGPWVSQACEEPRDHSVNLGPIHVGAGQHQIELYALRDKTKSLQNPITILDFASTFLKIPSVTVDPLNTLLLVCLSLFLCFFCSMASAVAALAGGTEEGGAETEADELQHNPSTSAGAAALDAMRAYRACLHCRSRKTKCNLDVNGGKPVSVTGIFGFF